MAILTIAVFGVQFVALKERCIMKNSVYIFCVIALILLSACSLSELDRDSNLLLTYKNQEYISLRNWYMVDNEYYTVKAYVGTSKASSVKNNKTVCVYSGTDEKFILAEMFPGDILFHKATETLPSFENIEEVEKITVNFYNKAALTLSEDSKHKFISLLSTYQQSSELIKGKKAKKGLASIEIYYKNYPAYCFVGQLIETEDGEHGFYKLNDNSSGVIDEYMVVSKELFS